MIYIAAGALCAGALIVLRSMVRSGHFVKAFILTALQGAASLMAVNILGLVSGVTLAVNWFSLTFCGIFGTPGTITLLMADLLFSLTS